MSDPAPAVTRDDRRFWRILLLIVLAALVLRVAYVAFAKTNQVIRGDQLFYNAEANRLARGDGFLEPFDLQAVARGEIREGTDPAADHPPLTVIVLAPVSFVTHQALIPQRLTMAVLGSVTVLVIGLLARRLAGDRAGWIAAGIAALYPNLWVNDGLMMSETLAALLVALALLYAYRLIREPAPWLALLVGALCALAAMARAELVLLVPLLAVPAALIARSITTAQRWKLAGLGVFAAVVVIGPWVGYNLARFKEPTFLSTNDGIALLGSNCDSVYFGHVGRTWGLYRPWDMVSYNKGEGREGWVTILGIITFYPLLLAAIAGWVVMRRRRWRSWLLLVPAVIVTIASAATYGQTRFRVPAEPTLVVLAAIAIAALVARDWPARRRPAAATEGQSKTIEASSSS